MSTLYRDGHGAYASCSEGPNNMSPVYVIAAAARRLTAEGHHVDLPAGYDADVLHRIVWITGDYGKHVPVSARQVDEVDQIARSLETHHRDRLTLVERDAIAYLRGIAEVSNPRPMMRIDLQMMNGGAES